MLKLGEVRCFRAKA